MTKDEDFKLLKIQTFILKVNIHCDGCKQEVKKLLQRIEGVYTVSIDAEHQRVTVSGNVDYKTLIKKLARSRKHAELWTQKPNNQSHKPNQQHQAAHSLKDGNKNNKGQPNHALIQGLKAFKNQHGKIIDSFSSDDEDCDDDEDEDEDDEDDEFQLLGNNMNQLNLLRQANNAANNMNQLNLLRQANNAAAAAAAAAAKENGSAGGNGNSGQGKKGGGNPNQNMVLKGPNGPTGQRGGLNGALPNNKMGNVVHLGGGNFRAGEGKRVSDIGGLMGMGGLQGLSGNNGLGFHQAQQQLGNTLSPGFPANGGGAGGFGGAHQAAAMMGNLQAYQNHPSSMMMNLRGLNNNTNNNILMNESRNMQQPQMMYNRAPQVPPYTGYYHPYYYPSPYLNHQSEAGDYGAYLFSDENTSSCAVM